MRFSLQVLVLASAIISAPAVGAQTQQTDSTARTQQSNPAPLYRARVVSRTAKAVNYRHRSGPTEVDLRGTALFPEAKGHATVNSKQGRIEIKTKLQKMPWATQFGLEYLTYVLWAITPEGRSSNLGELLIDDEHESALYSTTDLQTFGLIVTAEPYFSVVRPSDVVVAENEIRPDTAGTIEPIDARYELLPRGEYTLSGRPSELRPAKLDSKTPLELYEARNAVQIARLEGADRHAADSFQKASDALEEAETAFRRKQSKKVVAQTAREAVQTAQDAILIADKRQQEEQQAQERAAAAQAQAQAQTETEQRAHAEQQAQEAQRRQQQAEQQAAQTQAQAEAEARQRAEAEQERQRAQQQAEQAQHQAQQAEQMRQQAEQEKEKLREQLRQQLNAILQTRETARGLVVNMADVLFATGQYSLRPEAREKLAKLAGIVQAHPGLNLQIEGHTDSVGSDEFNRELSEKRANPVRDYLISQGVMPGAVTARGYGKSQPIASNDTSDCRQLNRRVEMIVSGDIIGVPVQASTSTTP
ncbi:MAG: OmpA family protein [Candidatus Acidiferrales bacterium]